MCKKLLPMILLLFAVPFLSGSAQQAMIQDDPEIQPYRHSMEPAGIAKTLAMWSSAARIPVPKKYHAVAAVNGTIYLFGGLTAGNYFDNKCYKFNTATNSWSQLANFPVSAWIFGQAQVVNGKIYLFCGLSNLNTAYAVVKNVWEYDPAADTYKAMAPIAFDQGFIASGVIDNKIYVICGSGSSNTEYVKRVQVFDPAANSWGTATNYPRDVRYATAATVNNSIIVTGGYNINYTPSRYVADTYVGSVTAGILTWTKKKDYPIGPTIYMSGAGVGDKAVFFGGRPSIDGNAPATQRSFRYTPASDTWETLELKPTGIQALIQAAVAGTRVYAPGGEDATASAIDVCEYLDAAGTPGPSMVLSNKPILVSSKPGESTGRSLSIKNYGTQDLEWTVAVDPASSWLSPSKTGGTIGSFSADGLDIQFNAPVTPGEYKADVVVSSNDPSNASVRIPVTFVVQTADVDEAPIVLLEEGTGAWCQYCPYGADSVKAVVQRFPGQVVAVSYHGGDPREPMLTPATDVWATNIGLQGWPSAAMNRIVFPGSSFIAVVDRSQWSSTVLSVLQGYRSPVGINITSKSFNPTSRQVSLTISLFFHQAMQENIRLNVAEVEDGLNWTQQFVNGQKIYPYYHENVLRQLYPDPYGEVISSGNYLQSQSTVSKTFTFTAKDSLPQKSRLIIFAHVSDGKSFGPVLQAKQLTFSEITGTYEPEQPADFALAQNYPNPFNPGTVINFSLPSAAYVTLKVTDLLGREVRTLVNDRMDAGIHTLNFDAGNLPSGFYMYTLKAGDNIQSRKMLLMK